MGATFGKNIKFTIFGESHGAGVGVVVDGLPAGLKLDMEHIQVEMNRRAPGQDELSTARREEDAPQILSGYFEGHTTGAPLCAFVYNGDVRSKDYAQLKDRMRPGHADYTGHMRYRGFNDYRGGGHFSGRLTAALVFAGAVCKQYLANYNINIAAHVQRLAGIGDRSFLEYGDLSFDTARQLKGQRIPLLNTECLEPMEQSILRAKKQKDSVGGIIECGIWGVPAGVGDPFFDSVESVLSQLLFSVPAIKGVEFGAGFASADMLGSECNDEFYYDEDGCIRTRTNKSGGLLGGISTGMPIVFRAVVRPTPSIAQRQNTVSLKKRINTFVEIKGRHDPCILPRAVPVIEAVSAIGLADLWKEHKACLD